MHDHELLVLILPASERDTPTNDENAKKFITEKMKLFAQCVLDEYFERVVVISGGQMISHYFGHIYLDAFSFSNIELLLERIQNLVSGLRLESLHFTLPGIAPTIPGPSVHIKDKMYIIGGIIKQASNSAALFSAFSKLSGESKLHAFVTVYETSAGEPRYARQVQTPHDMPLFAQGVAGDGKRYIYIAGGQTSYLDSTGSRRVFRFDTMTNGFNTVASLPHSSQGGALVYLPLAKTLHFIGGVGKRGYPRHNKIDQYVLKIWNDEAEWEKGESLKRLLVPSMSVPSSLTYSGSKKYISWVGFRCLEVPLPLEVLRYHR